MNKAFTLLRIALLGTACVLPVMPGCSTEGPEGLAPASPANVTVKMDFLHHPFPDIAMPTDLATRYDENSPTHLRLNASQLAPTSMERITRKELDNLDGWGVFGEVTIPFTGDIDVQSILAAHRDATYDQSNDVIYLINITPSSPKYGEAAYLDLGEGNFPKVVEQINGYWENDPRGNTLTILYDETDEDINGDGILQPEEDTDCDAVLDKPNYLPGAHPAADDLGARTDALMTFYERETHTVIAHPLVPLDERTTYAVVVTKRLKDLDGNPVGSPYEYVNHAAQTEKLRPLVDVLPRHGLSLGDIAFTWAYTTGSMTAPMIAMRDGLYGHGAQKHLSEQFPPDLATIDKLTDQGSEPYIVRGADFVVAMQEVLAELNEGSAEDSVAFEAMKESHQFVDFHVMGSFDSPQMFPREDAEGNFLPLDRQVWPHDLATNAAPARPERIEFWLTVPRKEVSARGEGKPAPLVLMGNGYGANKFQMFAFAGFFARAGLACMIIESVSHGFEFSDLEETLVTGIFESKGYGGFARALFTDRAFDQNNDNKADSGADFWTAYAFHTRDSLRQTVVDYMQLARIVKAMDGKRTWTFGLPGIAGDFDGDGALDIGGDAPMTMWGGSLGGILATVVGATEPNLKAISTVSAGGGLGEGASRSLQGGIREAFILRLMAPMYIGTPNAEVAGQVDVSALMPDLADDARVRVGALTGIDPGDTVTVTNLDNGKVGCSMVNPNGSFRVGVESGIGDRHVLRVYTGAVLTAREECQLQSGAEQRLESTLEQFQSDITFQYQSYEAGSPLRSLAEGLGLRRATPGLRRLLSLGQHILDPADPAVWAQYLGPKSLYFPGTGETVRTRSLTLTTVGDMGVPAAMGANIGRSAGLIDFVHVDPRYGATPNQVLIDHHVIEGVDTLNRYFDGDQPTLFDVDNLSDGQDDHPGTPRLDPPLRLVQPMNGGLSGALFYFVRPEGIHGGVLPGVEPDDRIEQCMSECTVTGEGDPCGCRQQHYFDPGMLEMNTFVEFLASEGTRITFDPCKERNDCDFIAPLSKIQ